LKNTLGQDVQLFVEGINLVDLDFFTVSDPQCSLKTKEKGAVDVRWDFVGETEVIDNNLNPKWIKHFAVKYIFNRDLSLNFEVWNVSDTDDTKDLIGQVIFSLSDILKDKNQEVYMQLTLPTDNSMTQKQIKQAQNRG
jgi:hypothetical protein